MKTKFTTQFRKSLIPVTESLDLLDITSPRQVKNGTIEFADPISSTESLLVLYTMRETGYVSRRLVTNDGTKIVRMAPDCLNDKGAIGRSLADRNAQLGILTRAVLRNRNR